MKLLPISFLTLLLLPLLTGLAAGTGTFQYLSPVPGSTMHRPETNIIIRHGELIDSSTVSGAGELEVTGSITGIHHGAWFLSDDSKTLVFNPAVPFEVGEQVNVFLHSGIRTVQNIEIGSVAFSFTITSSNIHLGVDPEGLNAEPLLFAEHKGIDSLPAITLLHSDNPSPGCIFISNIVLNGAIPNIPYLIVVNNSGTPVAYQMTGARSYDFKMQPNGTMTYYRSNISRHIVLDTAFQVLDTIGIRNGYNGALHELYMFPNGHALILGVDPQTIRMDTIVPGGNPAARVAGAVIQELDRANNVVFQWRSWDSFNITDATHENLTAAVIDYSHPNAVDVDADGNLLISSRHMDEITKVSRLTGRIIWRLGGRNNGFRFVNDTIGFSYQHAVRRIPNGHITLFDNGNYHTPPFSRAVEYDVNEDEGTATLTWQYRHSPDIFGSALGYVQRLDNGNTLIGWGASNPSVTEVRPDGSKALELTLPDGVFSYRAFRFPWTATASSVPAPVTPETFTLSQNYPNPFNPSTTIRFSLAQQSHATLTIHDILGKEIATLVDGNLPAGSYTQEWNAGRFASGVYIVALQTDHASQTRKLLLLR